MKALAIPKMIVKCKNDHSRWASGSDNWILTSVPEVYGVWNLATNYHGAYFLSFLQTSSLFQAPIQDGLAPDCVAETLYFTNICSVSVCLEISIDLSSRVAKTGGNYLQIKASIAQKLPGRNG